MKLKQLNIDMKEKDHRLLKKYAVEQGVPIKQVVINAIALYLRDYIAQQKLEKNN